jgi:hypothetical protein
MLKLSIGVISFHGLKTTIMSNLKGAFQTFRQCCGAENISFGFGSTEPQIRISAPAPDSFIRYLENYQVPVIGLEL